MAVAAVSRLHEVLAARIVTATATATTHRPTLVVVVHTHTTSMRMHADPPMCVGLVHHQRFILDPHRLVLNSHVFHHRLIHAGYSTHHPCHGTEWVERHRGVVH